MRNKLLTISVAAYNMEAYLNRCVDSLLIPEICSDIEVIIVNDGSTDKTLGIALEYQNNFPDTIKVINKPNGGYGSATNCAIDAATGEYFKILDADDWFDKKAFKFFICFLKKSNNDLVITHYSKENACNNDSYPVCYKGIQFEKTYELEKFCILDMTGESGFAMHTMTYRTEILRKNNFRVSECFYSDVDYSVYPLAYVKSLVFVDVILYKYLIGRDGQSVSCSGLIKHFDDHLYVCKKLIDYYANYHARSESILSLNIGYNAATITFHVINIIFHYLFNYDKMFAERTLNEFIDFLQGRDSDIYELAEERVAYYMNVR